MKKRGLFFGAAAAVAFVLLTAQTYNDTQNTAYNNYALQNLNSPTIGAVYTRLGFTTPGDAPPLTYRFQNGQCAAADNGAQVQWFSEGVIQQGCFMAMLPASGVSPTEWGAEGNGTVDDTVAVQAATNAVEKAGLPLYLGNHFYCITALSISAPVVIIGSYGSNVVNNSGFNACAQNANLITLASGSDGSLLTGFTIHADAAGANTSGGALAVESSHNRVNNVTILEACNYIFEGGNSNTYDQINLTGAVNSGAGCGGVHLGNSTSPSTDAHIINSVIGLSGPNAAGDYSYDQWLENASGLYETNDDLLYADKGTLIDPGANETVAFLFASNTVLGDTTLGQNMLIDTSSASAKVISLKAVGAYGGSSGCWKSSCTASANAFEISNTGGGTISGVHFTTLTTNNAGASGFAVDGAAGISDVGLKSSALCGSSRNSSGGFYSVNIGSANNTEVEDNRIGGNCHGYSSTTLGGIVVQGTNVSGPLMITDNNLNGYGTTPIALASALPTATAGIIIKNNAEVDDQCPSVASATTITAPVNPCVTLTGTTAVENMADAWQGRTLLITAPSGLATVTGGTTGEDFCNAITLAINQPYTAEYNNTCWRVH